MQLPKWRRSWWFAALAVLSTALAVSACKPGHPTDAVALWRELTKLDVEAAYSLLKDDHPAAAPEAGDSRFVAALEAAHARALSRAAQAGSHEGYIATLGEMANSMGDGHIRSYGRQVPRQVRWAGIIAARRAQSWVVAAADPRIAGAELTGAQLLTCDGRSAEEFGRDVLHYMTNVDVPAALAMNANWLFVDQGNPFLTPPRSCTFEHGGQKVTLNLNWQPISRTELIEHHWHSAFGEAGFGVRASGVGYWVGIEQLVGAKAQAVVDEVTQQAVQLRSAAYVVVDVRGNGGGNDHYMRELAWALYGQPYVDAILEPDSDVPGACQEVYRASADNIQAISEAAKTLRKQADTHGANEYVKAAQEMRTALAAGRALTGSPTCPVWKPPAQTPPPLIRAKVYILTDNACFSSCINGVKFFRQLGATQIGLPTSADTHYSEVREIVLPSGLATFSTQQGLMPNFPAAVGPYNPVIGYDGDITDTAALERWVRDLATPGA